MRVGQTAETKPVDGDLYVVTESASLNFASRPVNVRSLYASGKSHAELFLNEGVPITLALLRGQDPVGASLASAQPSSTKGILLDVHSPVHLVASDGQGRRLGFDGSGALGEIPNAALNRIGDAEVLTLAYGSAYFEHRLNRPRYGRRRERQLERLMQIRGSRSPLRSSIAFNYGSQRGQLSALRSLRLSDVDR